MRTKKAKSTILAPDNPDVQTTIDIASQEEREKANRVSFFVNDKGLPEWERVSPKTKAQLESILRDKSVQKELGITPEVAIALAGAEFGQDEAQALLDVIGGMSALAAGMIFKAPADICRQAYTYTPDHVKKLSPSMVRLMNKWGPAILKTWKDEIGFSLLMLSIWKIQFDTMNLLVEKRKRETGPRATPRPTPIKEEVAKPQEKVDTVIDATPGQGLA
jgi:hypothetical protein